MYCLYPEPADFKKWVDAYADDTEVFAAYGDFPVKGMFSSPFRTDRNPSCHLYKAPNGKLFIIDNTTKESFDFIDLVMKMEHLDFMGALDFIIEKFILKISPLEINPQTVEKMKRVKESVKASIKIRAKKWTKKELGIYERYHIGYETLKKYRTIAVQAAWINDNLFYSVPDNKDTVCFAYKLADREYQLYLPYRPKGSKYLSNSQVIMGFDMLPPRGELLIITKSMKDVMVLHEMGYNAIAPIGESSIVPEEILEALIFRFDRIIVFNDFDKTGISSSLYYRIYHSFESVFLTDGKAGTENYGSKDPSDLVLAQGFQKAKETVQALIKTPLIW